MPILMRRIRCARRGMKWLADHSGADPQNIKVADSLLNRSEEAVLRELETLSPITE